MTRIEPSTNACPPRRFPRALRFACSCAAAGICPAVNTPGAVPALPTTPVALNGDAAPGDDATTRYSRFGVSSINPSGQILFDAVLAGPNVTEGNDTAAITGLPLGGGGGGGGGGLSVLAREGQAAPGTPASVFGNLLGTSAINPEGLGIFFTELRTVAGGALGYGTVAGSPGDLRLVYRHGRGEAIIGWSVLNTGPRAVLWPQAANHLIYWTGAATSEVPTPGNYFQPTINRSGRIAFTAFQGDDQPPGLYAGPAGDFRPVAVVGGAAPGLPAGYRYSTVLNASQNNAGQFAFLAEAQSEDPNSYGWGLWAGQPDDLQLLARDGQQAPGLPAGYRFERILFDIDSPTTPPIGGAGHVPFWAFYSDPTGDNTGTGAWLARPGQATRLIASSGDVVPATGPGGEPVEVVLEHFDHDSLWVNAAGQVVIRADSGGDFGLRDTLVVADTDGSLRLIARVGNLFEVAPGDVRQVGDIFLSPPAGGQDGRLTPFNDAGQLLYTLTFVDGTSGLFITSVPEPQTATVCAAFGCALLARRRRRQSASREKVETDEVLP